MDQFRPSNTAMSVARLRARHQISEFASVFVDPYAIPILGEGQPKPSDIADEEIYARRLRFFVAARSRFADDCLAKAVGRGVRQAVILGAGLDTLSLRNPYASSGLHVFEVDHPATQRWKRQKLADAKLAEPPSTTFVPVDFENQQLDEELSKSGFRVTEQAFFIWLGVVPYLTRPAIVSTLSFIAAIPGSEVVFDYGEPPESRGEPARSILQERARKLAADGEPWLTFFDPVHLWSELRAIGFDEIEDLSGADIAMRYFNAAGGTKDRAGSHLIRARRMD